MSLTLFFDVSFREYLPAHRQNLWAPASHITLVNYGLVYAATAAVHASLSVYVTIGVQVLNLHQVQVHQNCTISSSHCVGCSKPNQ